VDIGRDDLNALKERFDLATSENSTFVSLSPGMIKDMVDNDLVAVSQKAAFHLPDGRPPILQKVSLDFSGAAHPTVTLSFDETVLASSLDPSLVSLQSTKGGSGAGHDSFALSAASVSSANSTEVTLTLPRDALDAFKAKRLLSAAPALYLSSAASGSGLEDMNQNPLPVVSAANAFDASPYRVDSTRPTLEGFELNMNLVHPRLTLTFSETIDHLELAATNVTFHACGLAGVQPYTLGGRESSSPSPARVAFIDLTAQDSNAIKAVRQLGTLSSSSGNTFISFPEGLVSDMAPSANAVEPSSQCFPATRVVRDLIRPNMTGFTLDLNTDTLTLSFDEAVTTDGFDVAGLELRSPDGNESRVLAKTGAPVTRLPGFTEIAVKLHVDDTNQVKRLEGLARSPETTVLVIEHKTVRDMGNNDVNPAAMAASASGPGRFVKDGVHPKLLAFDFDLTQRKLTLSFSETVRTSTLRMDRITLTNNQSEEVPFTSSSKTASASNDNILVVIVGQPDMNSFAEKLALAVSKESTFLRVSGDAIDDMEGNSVSPVAAIPVTGFKKDEVKPSLSSFELDLATEILALSFSESVAGSTLKTDHITFQNNRTAQGPSYRLSGGQVESINSDIINVKLSLADLNAIKAIDSLAAGLSNSWIIVRADAVSDLAQNPSVAIVDGNALQASKYQKDSVPPTLDGFGIAMDILTPPVSLVLDFSETVSPTDLATTGDKITLFDCNNVATGVKINGGTAARGTVTSQIVLTLADDTLDLVKDTLSVAQTIAKTCISLEAGAVMDMADVSNLKLAKQAAASHNVDVTPPSLLSSALDLTQETLTLVFDEAVRDETFDVSKITLVSVEKNQDGVHERRALTGGSVIGTFKSSTAVATTSDGKVVVTHTVSGSSITVKLTIDDLNDIKKKEKLAVADGSTVIVAGEGFVQDAAGNDALAIEEATGTEIGSFTKDETDPVLLGYTLSVLTGEISMTFSETVDVSTLDILGENLRLVNKKDAASASDGYSPSLAQTSRTLLDGTVLSLVLHKDDLDAIKFKKGLATRVGADDVFVLVKAGLVSDNAGNGVAVFSEGKPPQLFTPDSKRPSLSAWSIVLDTATAKPNIVLSYDETVDKDEVRVQEITLHSSVHGNETSVPLTAGAVTQPGAVTEAMITLDTVDLNKVNQARDLCTSAENDCYLAYTENSAKDMNQNRVLGAIMGSLKGPQAYISDSVGPELRTKVSGQSTINVGFSSFDLEKGIIVLSFDEVVEPQNFDPKGLGVQTDYTGALSRVMFNDGTQVAAGSQPDTRLTVQLSPSDLNTVRKTNRVCDARYVCYLYVTDAMVTDMNGRNVAPVTNQAPGHRLINFNDDHVSPTLIDFDFDLNDRKITMTFDEAVDTTTLDARGLTVQASASPTPALKHSLSGGTTASGDGTVIVVDLLGDDVKKIKSVDGLAMNESTTFLSLKPSTIKDLAYAANPATDITGKAIRHGGYKRDSVSPELFSYSLNLDTSLLELEFNEPVRVSTLDVGGLTIQADRDNLVKQYRALVDSAASTGQVDGSSKVVIKLSEGDETALETNTFLAKDEHSTYLAVAASVIKDMSGNAVKEIPKTDAKQVDPASLYTKDRTAAHLDRATLDMNKSTLSLHFTDVMDFATLKLTSLAIQAGAAGGSSIILNPQTSKMAVGTSNGHDCVIDISVEDLLRLNANIDLATGPSNTFLSIQATFLEDIAGTDIVAITPAKALAMTFVPDSTSPTITSFHMEMSTGSAVLTFSEPVNKSTFKPELLVLSNSRNATVSGFKSRRLDALTGFDYVPGSVQRELKIGLVKADFNELQKHDNFATIYNPTPTNNNVFLSYGLAVEDMFRVSIEIKDVSDAMPISGLAKDGLNPTLDGFGLDMEIGKITLTFSEIVRAANIDVSTIAVQGSAGKCTGNCHALDSDASTESTSEPSLVVAIDLSTSNLDNIKRLSDTATRIDNTFLFMLSAGISDMAGNGLSSANQNDSNALSVNAGEFVKDSSRPTIVSFTVDMRVGTIRLLFSETMLSSSLDLNHFAVQNDASSAAPGFQRVPFGNSSSMATVPSTERDSREIEISISKETLLQIKVILSLFRKEQNAYVSFDSKFMTDMSHNEVIGRSKDNAAGPAKQLIVDDVPPKLASFSLDMNNARLALTFDEIIDVQGTSFSIEELSIVGKGGSAVNLVSSGSSHSLIDSTRIDVTIAKDDLDKIKLDKSIAVSGVDDVFLSVGYNVTAARDVEGNKILPSVKGGEKPISQGINSFVKDITEPQVAVTTGFSLDVNTGLLVLSFTETVDLDTFDVSGITLVGQKGNLFLDDVSLTVTSSAKSNDQAPVPTSVKIQIGPADLNNIKHKKWLAKDEATTFLALRNTTIKDMAGNSVKEIARSMPLRVRVGAYIPDSTAPKLRSGSEYVLDLDSNTLLLNFDETVDFTTVDLSKITVQSKVATVNSSAPDQFTFTGPKYALAPSSFEDLKTSVRIHLLVQDLNIIKQKVGLAVSDATTVLSLENAAVFDTAKSPNAIKEVSAETGASHADDHVVDEVAPKLVAFFLDLNNGQMELEFTETVDSSTLLVDRLRLQNNATAMPAYYRRFGSPTKAMSAPGHKVVVAISEIDLNDIKAKLLLGTVGGITGNTYLAVGAGAIKDMAGNDATATENENSVRASFVLSDGVAPEVRGFEMHLTGENVTIYFTETIDRSTVDPQKNHISEQYDRWIFRKTDKRNCARQRALWPLPHHRACLG
jgi:hypothetical protein